jgi:hypothetical protein
MFWNLGSNNDYDTLKNKEIVTSPKLQAVAVQDGTEIAAHAACSGHLRIDDYSIPGF